MSDELDGFSYVPAGIDGWFWLQYSDGSGHLESPEGKSYFQYDLSTSEFKYYAGYLEPWHFMAGYPYEVISFSEFKERAERWVGEDGD